ncbi:hypothetical protein JCM21900_000509 [Sporobolomyces salmonicolor]
MKIHTLPYVHGTGVAYRTDHPRPPALPLHPRKSIATAPTATAPAQPHRARDPSPAPPCSIVDCSAAAELVTVAGASAVEYTVSTSPPFANDADADADDAGLGLELLALGGDGEVEVEVEVTTGPELAAALDKPAPGAVTRPVLTMLVSSEAVGVAEGAEGAESRGDKSAEEALEEERKGRVAGALVGKVRAPGSVVLDAAPFCEVFQVVAASLLLLSPPPAKPVTRDSNAPPP